MYRPKYTILITLLLLALVGLLALPIRSQAAGANYASDASGTAGRRSCITLPQGAGASASRNPRLCTPTPANTATAMPTQTNSPTETPANTATATLTPTFEPTVTNSPTATATDTPTNTATPEPTATNTPTATATDTPTNTATPEPTATNTPTATATDAPTNTPTATATDTPVPPTATATNTAVPPTSTPTPIPSASITVYNVGAFFVQYYVSYNLPGAPLQSLYSGVFNINQGVTLTIPGEATNVGVLVQYYTGITGWQNACSRAYAQATSAVIIVSGSTFFASCSG